MTTTNSDLLLALVRQARLDAVVPITLDLLEREPLATGGCFPGDLLRALLELPPGFWGRNPGLYARYRAALRAGAAARRLLPAARRMDFWSTLDEGEVLRARAEGGDDDIRAISRHG